MQFDKELLKNLVCPITKGSLTFDEETNFLISEKAKLKFPIRNGIPILLPEEAEKID